VPESRIASSEERNRSWLDGSGFFGRMVFPNIGCCPQQLTIIREGPESLSRMRVRNHKVFTENHPKPCDSQYFPAR